MITLRGFYRPSLRLKRGDNGMLGGGASDRDRGHCASHWQIVLDNLGRPNQYMSAIHNVMLA